VWFLAIFSWCGPFFFLVHGWQTTFFCHLMESVEVSGLFYYYWADTNPLLQLRRRQSFSLRVSFLWCCPQLWLAFVGLWHSFFCRYIMIVAWPLRWWLCSFRKWRHCCRCLEKIFFLQPLGSVICSRICFWFNINGWMDLLFAWICNSGILGGVAAVDCRKKNMVCFSSLLNCSFSLHLDSLFHAV